MVAIPGGFKFKEFFVGRQTTIEIKTMVARLPSYKELLKILKELKVDRYLKPNRIHTRHFGFKYRILIKNEN
jgi:hypothetical protein